MNDLIEKLMAIREDIESLFVRGEAVTLSDNLVYQRLIKLKDPKEVLELLEQKMPAFRRNYKELFPYMTGTQRSKAGELLRMTPENVRGDFLPSDTRYFEKFFRLLIDDVDALYVTVEWLSAIAVHMGCPVSELARFNPWGPWPFSKSCEQIDDAPEQ